MSAAQAPALEALTLGQASLPVIDVGGLFSDRPADLEAVAYNVRQACLDKGFFYMSGHRVEPALQDEAFACTRQFFAQPEAAKLRVDKAASFCNRGYERMGGQTLETGAPPDLKEGFYLGPDLPLDDPRVVARKFNRGPNQWPEGLSEFRGVMTAYLDAMLALSRRLMAAIARSLDLPGDHFDAFCAEAHGTLRLLHYPPQPLGARANEKGAGAHTDFGALTILAQDALGGLQVWDAATARWVHATPIPGTFVVNLGDMMARWTNDRYRSTLHRVVNVSGHERYSIPFFYMGNPDTRVECLPTCLAPGASPKYPPITVEDHVRSMYRKTYGPAQ